MSQQHYLTLFAYSQHTAQRLLDKAALLDEADLHAPSVVGHGSIHDIFFHLLSASQGWRVALETGQQPRRLKPAGYETLAAVREALLQEYRGWLAYLNTLDDAAIQAPLELSTARGDKVTMIQWRVLQHLILHFMQHHTEIAHLLTQKGQSPGDIDFLFYQG